MNIIFLNIFSNYVFVCYQICYLYTSKYRLNLEIRVILKIITNIYLYFSKLKNQFIFYKELYFSFLQILYFKSDYNRALLHLTSQMESNLL